MSKGLFVCAALCALLIVTAGCSVQAPPPPQVYIAPPPPEGASTTAQMANVQRIMNTPEAQAAGGESDRSLQPLPGIRSGEEILGKDSTPYHTPAPPPSASPRPAAVAAAPRPASPKAPARTTAGASAKPAARPASTAGSASAKPGSVAHGTLVSKSGSAGRGTIVVDADGKGNGKASYATTASTYFEKVVDGAKYGKDLRMRGSWSDLAAGKRVWVRLTKAARPTVAAVATYVFPTSRAEYERYRKLYAR